MDVTLDQPLPAAATAIAPAVPSPRRWVRMIRHGVVGVCLAAILYFYCNVQYHAFLPGQHEPDLDGYVWLAKRIAHFQPLHVRQENPFQFQSHVWVENAQGLVTVKFAPGYSLLMAIFSYFGDTAMFMTSPVCVGIGLIGAYFLFRRWMGTVASLLATLTICFNPTLILYSGYMLSHAADLCFVTWGMLFLFLWIDRPRWHNALAAGLVLGFTVVIRHADAMFASCVLVAVVAALIRGWSARKIPWKPIAMLVGAYAVFPLAMMVYNKVLFDSPFVTGYGLTQEQDAFSKTMLLDLKRWRMFALNAYETTYFLTLPLGLLGAVVLGPWPSRLIRLLWILPVSALYVSYYWYMHGPGEFRFLLPITVPLVGLSFAVMDRLAAAKTARIIAMVLLCAFLYDFGSDQIDRALAGTLYQQRDLSRVVMAQVLKETIRPDAVIFAYNRFDTGIGQRQAYTLYNLAMFEQGDHEAVDKAAYALQRVARQSDEPQWQTVRAQRLVAFYETTSEERLLEGERQIIDQALAAGRQVIFLIPGDRPHLSWLNNTLNLKLLRAADIPSGTSNRNFSRGEKWGIYQATVR